LLGVVVFVPAGYFLGRAAGLDGPLEGGFIGMLMGFVAADFGRYLVVGQLARWNGMSSLSIDVTLSLVILAVAPAGYFGGEYLGGLLGGGFENPKVRTLVVFLCQGTLVVLMWGLLYLIWFRKHLGKQ
jgi:hypothetical protein